MTVLKTSNSEELVKVASSTLCNLLLEFSPAKEQILGQGAVEFLCGLTRRPHPGLRLNAVWALMNMAFQAELRVKVMNMAFQAENLELSYFEATVCFTVIDLYINQKDH